jgi:hypothetical protein
MAAMSNASTIVIADDTEPGPEGDLIYWRIAIEHISAGHSAQEGD